MVKNSVLIAVFFLTCLSASGQSGTRKSSSSVSGNGQAIAKGKTVAYLGVGAGYGYSSRYRSRFNGAGYVYRTSPTFHLGFEHGVSESVPESVIGLGGDLSIWGGRYTYVNKNGFGWEQRWRDVTALVKCYYHHKKLMGEKWDLYAAVMAGVKYRSYKYTTTDPYYDYLYDDESGLYGAAGLALGARIYLTKSLGLYLEGGGGYNHDYLHAGLVFKL
ncbi:MAG: hypothetical protein QM534_12370 [Sediminibacterium sp.]|nr:hypothetical protein [Sediminibacterium sp.]